MQQDLGKCMITSIRIIFTILAFSAWNENETSLTMFLGSEILLKIVFVFPYPTVTVENK